MARDIYRFTVTVPAGTAILSPIRQAMTVPVRVIERIHWRLPPGCMGIVGFYVSMGGVQVQPLPIGSWETGDGISGNWDVEDQPTSGAWQLTAYNLGSFPHSIHIAMYASLTEKAAQLVELVPHEALDHYSSQLGAWHG